MHFEATFEGALKLGQFLSRRCDAIDLQMWPSKDAAYELGRSCCLPGNPVLANCCCLGNKVPNVIWKKWVTICNKCMYSLEEFSLPLQPFLWQTRLHFSLCIWGLNKIRQHTWPYKITLISAQARLWAAGHLLDSSVIWNGKGLLWCSIVCYRVIQ